MAEEVAGKDATGELPALIKLDIAIQQVVNEGGGVYPCPFCGDGSPEYILVEPAASYAVRCKECRARGPLARMPEETIHGTTWGRVFQGIANEAVAGWNRRAE